MTGSWPSPRRPARCRSAPRRRSVAAGSGPGELLLVEPGRRAILEDTEAKTWVLRDLPIHDAARPTYEDRVDAATRGPRGRARPTTSCATSPDSTPSVPGSTSRRWRSKATSRCGAWATTRRRPAAAGSTGRSPTTSARRSPRSRTRPSTPNANGSSWTSGSSSAGGRRSSAARRAARGRVRLARPIVVDLDGLLAAMRAGGGRSSVRTLDATWDRDDGPGRSGRRRWIVSRPRPSPPSRRGAELLVLTDAAWSLERLPIPSILADGRRPHRADRGGPPRSDGPGRQRRRHPRRPRDGDGPRGRCDRRPAAARHRARRRAGGHARRRDAQPDRGRRRACVAAFEAGLRKTLARMGISAVASYIGGVAHRRRRPRRRSVVARCFPNAAAWPGRTTLADLGARQLRRRAAAAGHPRARRRSRAAPARPGLRAVPGRRRGPPVLAAHRRRDPGPRRRLTPTVAPRRHRRRPGPLPDRPGAAGERPVRAARRAARPARPRRRCRSTRSRTPASIVRRFVVSAMSVGALSPEAHQALTIGIQRAGGAANTGEGGEDPAWYEPGPRRPPPRRADQAGRVGPVRRHRRRTSPAPTSSRSRSPRARSPARAASCPGARRRPTSPPCAAARPGRATSARRRTTTSTRSRTWPSSSPTCGRSTRRARIGVKLVAGRGVGTIAAGVAKAGAVVHPPVRPRRRDRGVAAVVDQARRGAVGARPGRGPPDAAPQRPARPRRAAHRRRAADRPRPARGRAARRRGVRVRDGGARRDRLRHGPPVPSRHLPDRDRDPARGPPGQVRRDARRRRCATSRPSPRTSAASWQPSGHARSARSSARAGASCARARRPGAELAPVIGAGSVGGRRRRAGRDPSSAGRDIGRAPASALEVGIAAAFRGQGPVTRQRACA